jgi:hypothetical protein
MKKVEMKSGERTEAELGPIALNWNPRVQILSFGRAAYFETFEAEERLNNI